MKKLLESILQSDYLAIFKLSRAIESSKDKQDEATQEETSESIDKFVYLLNPLVEELQEYKANIPDKKINLHDADALQDYLRLELLKLDESHAQLLTINLTTILRAIIDLNVNMSDYAPDLALHGLSLSGIDYFLTVLNSVLENRISEKYLSKLFQEFTDLQNLPSQAQALKLKLREFHQTKEDNQRKVRYIDSVIQQKNLATYNSIQFRQLCEQQGVNLLVENVYLPSLEVVNEAFHQLISDLEKYNLHSLIKNAKQSYENIQTSSLSDADKLKAFNSHEFLSHFENNHIALPVTKIYFRDIEQAETIARNLKLNLSNHNNAQMFRTFLDEYDLVPPSLGFELPTVKTVQQIQQNFANITTPNQLRIEAMAQDTFKAQQSLEEIAAFNKHNQIIIDTAKNENGDNLQYTHIKNEFTDAFIKEANERISQLIELNTATPETINAIVVATWKNYATLAYISAEVTPYCLALEAEKAKNQKSFWSRLPLFKSTSLPASKKFDEFKLEDPVDIDLKIDTSKRLLAEVSGPDAAPNSSQRLERLNSYFIDEKGIKVHAILGANRDNWGQKLAKSIINILCLTIPYWATGKWLWKTTGEKVEENIKPHLPRRGSF